MIKLEVGGKTWLVPAEKVAELNKLGTFNETVMLAWLKANATCTNSAPVAESAHDDRNLLLESLKTATKEL